MQRILHRAGGVEQAARIIEHYCEVGCDHLIPAYAKYNWTWVQYYNADVYALLALVGTVLVIVLMKCCRMCKRCCCGNKRTGLRKDKKD